MKIYRVGTFPPEPDCRSKQPMAYLRDYNPQWEGCIEFDVEATSGKEAKRIAVKLRQEHDAAQVAGR